MWFYKFEHFTTKKGKNLRAGSVFVMLAIKRCYLHLHSNCVMFFVFLNFWVATWCRGKISNQWSKDGIISVNSPVRDKPAQFFFNFVTKKIKIFSGSNQIETHWWNCQNF